MEVRDRSRGDPFATKRRCVYARKCDGGEADRDEMGIVEEARARLYARTYEGNAR